MNCLFCKIIGGEIETQKIYEDDDFVAFFDIHPLADTHILILPREHISTFLNIESTHESLLIKMVGVAQKLIKDYNLEGAYRMMFNGGRNQHVPHLHWHLLGGNVK